ncbi:MAG: D-inositol-3-phosphate glycosyltransferase [Steroidobacteraceae bacterium]|nr:D-inositol-3-phosphate glycosyltransferase [Steroidobacteraceae bacterium]
MLRVASVCRTLPIPTAPGAGVFVLRRLAAMAETSDIRILQPVPCLPPLRRLPDWARSPTREIHGRTIHHAAMWYLPGLLKPLDARWLERAILPRLRMWHRQKPIDVVDAHFGYPDGVGCVRAARRLGLPVFVTIRGFEAERMEMPGIGKQITEALIAANGCISVSHSLRDKMLDHGVPAERIVVIPNAVDREIFRPGDKMSARQALSMSTDGELVVSVGHLVSLKRHDVVLRAIGRLRRRGRPVRLAIIGGADYEPEYPTTLRRLAVDLGVERHVQFVGAVEPVRVADWLRAADVFALGTRREGCCNAILESLATGTPVVTTPVGDNPHFIKDGENGTLVPVGDDEAMARAIELALGRDWDHRMISARLEVGGWSTVGREVLAYIEDRLQ